MCLVIAGLLGAMVLAAFLGSMMDWYSAKQVSNLHTKHLKEAEARDAEWAEEKRRWAARPSNDDDQRGTIDY